MVPMKATVLRTTAAGPPVKGKGEIQGSLRCATDDETVRRFGRDDVLLWWGLEAPTYSSAGLGHPAAVFRTTASSFELGCNERRW